MNMDCIRAATVLEIFVFELDAQKKSHRRHYILVYWVTVAVRAIAVRAFCTVLVLCEMALV